MTEQITFNPDQWTVLYTIPKLATLRATSDTAQSAANYDMVIKPEFHITLVGFALGRTIQSVLENASKDEIEKIESLFIQVLQDIDWSYTINSEYYLISKRYKFRNKQPEQRTSIIATVTMPALHDFFTYLAKTFAITIDEPYPHVTLYSTSTNPNQRTMGIGITDKQSFLDLNPTKL